MEQRGSRPILTIRLPAHHGESIAFYPTETGPLTGNRASTASTTCPLMIPQNSLYWLALVLTDTHTDRF